MRQISAAVPRWTVVDEDPPFPTAQELQARTARARAHARSLYRGRLRDMLSAHGVGDAAGVAEAVMQTLFGWADVTTGELCRCSCHPQLPASELHDYGASCGCTRTPEQRRASRLKWLDDIQAFWRTPEGQQLHAAHEAEEAALQDWVARHPGVVVHSHEGWAPEQWTGEVDGHRFYFRERHGDWHLEIDLSPWEEDMPAADRPATTGATAVERGDVIATGTVETPNYGDTTVQRAQFIITTIRDHLRRQTCPHRGADGHPLDTAADDAPRWCPDCGTRLHTP